MDGVLIIDKPVGFTSHDVVARVRRILRERRVGHTGTLDPFATGVLVILVGRATRLAQFLSGAEKEYEAVIRLGYATDTGDLTGKPLPVDLHAGKMPSQKEIEAAMASLRGEIEQVPPMYSAKKQQGRKLYELARRGEEVERAAVSVTIHEFEALPREGHLLIQSDDGTGEFSARVVCSAGTYIRTLAEDLGRSVGLGAHLVGLRRTRAGDFHIAESVDLQTLEESFSQGGCAEFLIATDAALSRLPFMHLTAADVARVRNGMRISVADESAAGWVDGAKVRMREPEGSLIAVGLFDKATAQLQPTVVLG